MTTLRMPTGRALSLRPPVWLWVALLFGILVAGCGILGWLWWERVSEAEMLEQEIVALNTEHSAAVAALVARIGELEGEKAARDETIAELDSEVAYLTSERERLLAHNDLLLARLNACLEELNQPKPVQEVVPGMVRDNAATIIVIDDSGSMAGSVPDVREALRGVSERVDELSNADLSALTFGTEVQRLFDFTAVDLAPWDYAYEQIDAGSGGTNIYLALETAYNDIRNRPQPEKRILLLTDGQGAIAPELIRVVAQENIMIDTVPFGNLADLALLQQIADDTGGMMRRAN